ncbi:GNAT family N-acetyltransferase [Vibrio atypicus]|uniref:GNAT family N-acetyltransferase n=1 Tax=Vibrio atypicus TaxID=558271 RepID=UPI0037360134
MLVLREMRQGEFDDYCRYFTDDYSQEIVKNYGHGIEKAVELANQDLIRCFPNGLESNEHSLLCIDVKDGDDVKLAGYLWHSVSSDGQSTFIYDFYIFEEFRGRGFGTKAMSALESQMRDISVQQVKLRVAYHNERALKLYKEVGFSITGFNMSKTLE